MDTRTQTHARKNNGNSHQEPDTGVTGVSPEEIALHMKRWLVFAHLAKWFTIHIAIGLVGIYFLLMDNMPMGGLFLAAGAAVLVYGVATVPREAPRVNTSEINLPK